MQYYCKLQPNIEYLMGDTGHLLTDAIQHLSSKGCYLQLDDDWNIIVHVRCHESALKDSYVEKYVSEQNEDYQDDDIQVVTLVHRWDYPNETTN